MSFSSVELGKVADINPRLPRDADETQMVSFLTMASVSEKGEILNQEDRVLSEVKKGFTYFERNDVLLAKITPCFENGKAVYVDKLNHQIGYGSTEFHVLRPRSDLLDAKYLFYMVWNDRFRFLGGKVMKGAAGQKRVGADYLKEFKIPLPPLAEQKRIAAILDKADSLRRKRQQAIQLADDFLRAVFLDMFGDPITNPKGWDNAKLGNVTEFENGDRSSNYPSGNDLKNEGVLFLNTKNIVNGNLCLNDKAFIGREKFDSLSRGKLKRNDLVITLRGTLGSCAKFDCEYETGFINAQLMIIRAGRRIEPNFLHSYLTSVPIQQKIKSIGQGAAVPQLTASQLKDFDVYLPPVEEQLRFNSCLKNYKKISASFLDANKQNLFEALSQKAFAGEL